MGVDIHMSIINKKGEFVQSNIFDGRDSEWFDNLQNKRWNNIYNELPNCNGIPDVVPNKISEDYRQESGYKYYGFHYMIVKDFCEWFDRVKPNVDAGWLSTYEKWLYETKGIYPNDPPHYLDSDYNPHDYYFVEIVNPYDCSKWLYDYVKNSKNNVSEEDYIVYYFDC